LETEAAVKVGLSFLGRDSENYPAHFYAAQASPLRNGFAVANSSAGRTRSLAWSRSKTTFTRTERMTRLCI
jgi:hypothetical protein